MVATEWDSLPNNTFSNLGSHTFIVGIEPTIKSNNAFFYPNPTTNGWFMVKGTEIIKSVEIMNVAGQSVMQLQNPNARGDMKISTIDLTEGVYMVRINFADHTSIVKISFKSLSRLQDMEEAQPLGQRFKMINTIGQAGLAPALHIQFTGIKGTCGWVDPQKISPPRIDLFSSYTAAEV
ncbi:MAG: hypothetical protein DSY57_04400 [Desulfobulbus sp.]|nr:MAG: hypothetical protein DSY57_04400 [Desulfobulbus sp.]